MAVIAAGDSELMILYHPQRNVDSIYSDLGLCRRYKPINVLRSYIQNFFTFSVCRESILIVVNIRLEVLITQKLGLKISVCIYAVGWTRGCCKRYWTDFVQIFTKPLF